MLIVVDQKVKIFQEVLPKNSLDLALQSPKLTLFEGVLISRCSITWPAMAIVAASARC